jgi:hypothetical protein
VRSRPATILRPTPAASQRPVPTAPLTHPIGGGHLHEASSGVHSRSPISPRWLAATPEPESATASRRSSPRPRPPDGTAAASASTPGFTPRGHPQSMPGRRQALRALARVLHLRHQPNLQTVPPTSLMHPRVAHNPRWLPLAPLHPSFQQVAVRPAGAQRGDPGNDFFLSSDSANTAASSPLHRALPDSDEVIACGAGQKHRN